MKYGFIGLGLIGGSIAKAIRSTQPDAYIIATSPNPSTVNNAVTEGVVNKRTETIDDDYRDCDYIFLCAPVEINNDNLRKLIPHLGERTIITDIGSVKGSIHAIVSELGIEGQFIGGHPMTGTERIGFQNSKAVLLENAYYILTKTDHTDAKMLDQYYSLVKSLGSIPIVVPYQQHDYITAAISHVPHVVSASLVNLVKENDSADGLMKMIAAGGFKDITRISSSSAIMWQQICMTNKDNICELLDKYIAILTKTRDQISAQQEKEVYDFFDSARHYRDSFIDASRGPIKEAYVIHVDIADQPGNLAAVAKLLADNNINIKNIGIVHNREYERGTLRIELHDNEGKNSAIKLLQLNGYNTNT